MTQTSVLGVDSQRNFGFENPSSDLIQKILAAVAYERAFFFYEDIGKPAGNYAVSLSDFCRKINSISFKSLAFHLKRGDFENWIRETIGDRELSKRMGKLRTTKTVWKNEVTLRTKLHNIVKDRISELQDSWHHSLTRPISLVT